MRSRWLRHLTCWGMLASTAILSPGSSAQAEFLKKKSYFSSESCESDVSAPSAPTPAQPSSPAPEPDTSFGSEQFGALGDTMFAAADGNVGYIDSAIIRSQIRLRYDAGFDINRPDRAEFFYAKCGCFREAGLDPQAASPGRIETSIDYQDVWLYGEFALSERFSLFVEAPWRFLNPEINDNANGIGDLQAGFKYGLIAETDRALTFQVRTYAPTGNAVKGLGTDHVSIEPAILLYNRLSDRLTFEAEFRDWIGIRGTDFTGNVLRYGAGLGYDVVQRCNYRITPVAEVVGWTVMDGQEFDPGIGVLDAEGTTIVNAKLGTRVSMGENSSIYMGYGRALTGAFWYQDIYRVEYRWIF